MPVNAVPKGFHTVTPYLLVDDCAKLIEFMKHAFDAQEIERMEGPDGKVVHAQVKIGDSMVMMGGAGEQFPAMPASLHLYIDDADVWYDRAMRAGATSIMPVATQFYGDRSGGVKDPTGNVWWISTHVEDVSPEELRKRAAAQGK